VYVNLVARSFSLDVKDLKLMLSCDRYVRNGVSPFHKLILHMLNANFLCKIEKLRCDRAGGSASSIAPLLRRQIKTA